MDWESGEKLAVELGEVLERNRKDREIPGAIEAIGIILHQLVSGIASREGDSSKETIEKGQNAVIEFITAMMRKGIADDV